MISGAIGMGLVGIPRVVGQVLTAVVVAGRVPELDRDGAVAGGVVQVVGLHADRERTAGEGVVGHGGLLG